VMLAGNVVPAGSDAQGIAALAEWLAGRQRTGSSVVGLARDVAPLWEALGASWGPVRECRWHQPLMVAGGARSTAPDARVRPATVADIEPCIPRPLRCSRGGGRSPLVGSSEAAYRVGWPRWCGPAGVPIDDRWRSVFKAEVAATRQVCQVQGVWCNRSSWSGTRIAAMAAVVTWLPRLSRQWSACTSMVQRCCAPGLS
jgi:hypothetical protein